MLHPWTKPSRGFITVGLGMAVVAVVAAVVLLVTANQTPHHAYHAQLVKNPNDLIFIYVPALLTAEYPFSPPPLTLPLGDGDDKKKDILEAFAFEVAFAAQKACFVSNDARISPSLQNESESDLTAMVLSESHYAAVYKCIQMHYLPRSNQLTLKTQFLSRHQVSGRALPWMEAYDHWVRSMLWAMRMMEMFSGEDHDSTRRCLQDMQWRMNLVNELHHQKDEIMAQLAVQFRIQFEEEPQFPDYITIALNDWAIRRGSVGLYVEPRTFLNSDKNEKGEIAAKHEYGILFISTDALRDRQYLYYVLLHELIHASFGNASDSEGHGPRFRALANAMKLPVSYQD